VVKSEGPNSASGYAFRVEVSGVPSEVCKRINNMNPQAVDKIEPALSGCGDSVLDKMIFYFDENFGNNLNGSTDENEPGNDDTENNDSTQAGGNSGSAGSNECSPSCGVCDECVNGVCQPKVAEPPCGDCETPDMDNNGCYLGTCSNTCTDCESCQNGRCQLTEPDPGCTAPKIAEKNAKGCFTGECICPANTPTECTGECEVLEQDAVGCNVCVDKSIQIQTGECCDSGLTSCCPLNGNICNKCEPTNTCCGKELPTCGECEHLISDEVECWHCEADASKNGNSCSSNGEVGSCFNGTCKTTSCKEGKVSCGIGTNTWCCNEGNTCGVSTGECCLDGYCCQGDEKPYKYFVYQAFETRYGCCITDPEETPEYSSDPNNELATSSRVCCTAEKPIYHLKVSACGDVYDCFEDTPELTSKHFADCCQAGGICETITTYGYDYCPNGYGDWYTPEMSVMSRRDCLSEVEPAPEPETYCTEITKKSGSVYRVCCNGGNATQVAGGFYVCNSPCTGDCTETLISE